MHGESLNQLRIIRETSDWVAIDKPSGWLSVPSRMGATDKRLCVGTTLSTILGLRLYPVHRLDFEVSGVLVFAKNPTSHRQWSAMFENQKIMKTYHCITDVPENGWDQLGGLWESKVVRGKKRSFEAPYGKVALTQAKPMEVTSLGLLWELLPKTGRPHQLRFEMFKRGLPILGDTLYGGRVFTPSSIALRCVSLKFICSDLYRSEDTSDEIKTKKATNNSSWIEISTSSLKSLLLGDRS